MSTRALTPLEQARQLAAIGFSLFPVPRPRNGVTAGSPGDGKTPAFSWKAYQERRATDDELGRWFHREQNLAIITGAISGVVVVDADSSDALRWCVRNLPRTPWQVKTARGYHLYYRHPGVPVGNKARMDTRDGKLALDCRGDGGYVIGPGSIHSTGVEYEAGPWSTRDQVPRFSPDWLRRPDPPTSRRSTATPRPTGNVVERARKYLDAIPRPEIGQGSDAATLYAACRLTRGFDLSAADAEELLWEWAGGRVGWTREWITEKVEHARTYGTEPVGALR